MASFGNPRMEGYVGISPDDNELRSTRPEPTPSGPEGQYLDSSRLLPAHRQSAVPESYPPETKGNSRRDRGKGKDKPPSSISKSLPEWNMLEEPGELQTQFNVMDQSTQSHLARRHAAKKQFFHLLLKVMLRWTASFILSVAMLITFYYYGEVKVLDDSQKQWFNIISTGLYLALGLNLAGSFKGMATIMRWKLLSRKKHQLEEVDYLLGMSSLIKVFKYGIHALNRRPLTSLACFFWLLINCVGRLSFALTGIAYSYDSAGAIVARPGIVNITDFTYVWPYNNTAEVPTEAAEFSTANSWGIMSSLLAVGNTTDNDFNPDYQYLEWNGTNWIYHMREFMPHVTPIVEQNVAHRSDRGVTVSSTCEYYPLISGQWGNSSVVVYRNGTYEETLEKVSNYAPGATTWINPRSDLPKNSDWYCGPRCASIAALQFLDPDNEDDVEAQYGGFFACEVVVSEVQNATLKQQEIPDRVAWIAAGAIGLDGYSEGPDQWEYVRYFRGTKWGENLGDNSDEMARLVGQFAIGVVATRDLFGPRTEQVLGMQPWVGVLLKVYWPQFLSILGGILLVQLIMALGTVIYANTVFCKDDSYLSTAPVVERLGPSGCALTGRDISDTLHTFMVYGVRTDSSGIRHHLDIGEDIAPKSKFPEGWYDGEIGEMAVDDGASSTSGSRSSVETVRCRRSRKVTGVDRREDRLRRRRQLLARRSKRDGSEGR
ncbi:hypothetical protein RUND412_007709 [Rhizina undulata]